MNLKKIKNKKMLKIYIAIGVLAVIILSVYIIKGLGRVTTDDAYVEGRIHSIASKVAGKVKVVNVDNNQLVQKGNILIEIDPADYELKVHEVKASLDIRKSLLKQSILDKNRAERLYKMNAYSKERYENALTAYNLAKAQVEATQAQLKMVQRNLEDTKVYAPSNGNVTKKSCEVGNLVQPGQPLMAVVALDDVWVTANYKETQLEKVRPGQRVEIKIDTYPGRTFTGKVDSIMAGTGAAFSLFPPENALGSYVKIVQRIPVKIILDKNTDTKHVLRIGMSCKATIITKE